MIRLIGRLNVDIDDVALEKALKNAVKSAKDLMKVSRHIDKVLNAKTVEEV